MLLVLRRWLPALILCAFIFTTSSYSGASVSNGGIVDYLVHRASHLVLYSILCFLFFKAVKSPTLAVLLTILYGISDETHQLFVPGREGNLADIFVDSLAALITGVILWKFYHLLPQTLKTWLEE